MVPDTRLHSFPSHRFRLQIDTQPLGPGKIKSMNHQMNTDFCRYATFLDLLGALAQLKYPHPWISFSHRLNDFLTFLSEVMAVRAMRMSEMRTSVDPFDL